MATVLSMTTRMDSFVIVLKTYLERSARLVRMQYFWYIMHQCTSASVYINMFVCIYMYTYMYMYTHISVHVHAVLLDEIMMLCKLIISDIPRFLNRVRREWWRWVSSLLLHSASNNSGIKQPLGLISWIRIGDLRSLVPFRTWPCCEMWSHLTVWGSCFVELGPWSHTMCCDQLHVILHACLSKEASTIVQYCTQIEKCLKSV